MGAESVNGASQGRSPDLRIDVHLVERAKADGVELVDPADLLNALTRMGRDLESTFEPVADGA